MSAGNREDYNNNDSQEPQWLVEASAAVRMPATLSIMVGVLGAVLAILGLIQLDSYPRTLEKIIATIEADPKIPKAEKDKQIDLWTALKDIAEERTAFLIYYTLNIVCSLFVVFGGICMLRLSGPYIPMFSSLVSMLPCALPGCCCCLGMPVGIWALVVLNRPSIRSAMARGHAAEALEEPNDR